MRLKPLFLGLLFTLHFMCHAQNNKKEVLFTIDKDPYYTDEFARVYNKNLDLVKDESQKDLNNYLDLFVGYKLKITKANSLGLQNGEAYKNELKTYRTQLSKSYLTDSAVTKELVEEAYSRSLKEIRGSHILVLLDENASPTDTLVAYKKIVEIRNKAEKGEDFGTLAVQYSEDPSAKENKGDLGYFSVFRMVYPFESAAYKTQKGQVSQPFRTRFGYHIVNVVDIRDNRGEVVVEHIMILNKKEGTIAEQAKAKTTIYDIYKKIQQGEKFEDLAKQFSEDKTSSQKGGLLNRFGSGQLSSEEFETMAFSLTVENPISKPFETAFGWHIIKLIEKFNVKSFEEIKPEFESKISKDDRSRLITNSLNEKLRKQFPIKRNDKLYALLSKSVNSSVYSQNWEIPANTKSFNDELFTIKTKVITGTDFLNYVKTHQKPENNIKPLKLWIDTNYQNFVDEQLKVYYSDNLETEFPEFKAVMEEYRDGLLLFDLMEKEIWDKSKTDTIGLENFYKLHKEDYKWKNRFDVTIISSTNMDAIKKAQKMLKKGNTSEEIKAKLNVDDKVLVMSNAGIFEEDNEALPKNLKFETGVSEIIKDGEYYFVCQVNKTISADYKSLEECKGKVINDYQQYLEANWVGELRKEYTVKVYPEAFQNVKTELGK